MVIKQSYQGPCELLTQCKGVLQLLIKPFSEKGVVHSCITSRTFLEIYSHLRLKKSVPKTSHRSDTSCVIACDVDIQITFKFIACTRWLLEFPGYLKVGLIIQALCHEALAICQWYIILRTFLALMRCCKVAVNCERPSINQSKYPQYLRETS